MRYVQTYVKKKNNIKGNVENIQEDASFWSDWQHIFCVDSVGRLFGDSRVYLKKKKTHEKGYHKKQKKKKSKDSAIICASE